MAANSLLTMTCPGVAARLATTLDSREMSHTAPSGSVCRLTACVLPLVTVAQPEANALSAMTAQSNLNPLMNPSLQNNLVFDSIIGCCPAGQQWTPGPHHYCNYYMSMSCALSLVSRYASSEDQACGRA